MEARSDGGTICFLFNKIANGKTRPKYISTDKDPLFKYWLWISKLQSYLQNDEIKSMSYGPRSRLCVERVIASWRREFAGHLLFWDESDLLAKLFVFQEYFKSYGAHVSHNGKTPSETAGQRHLALLDVKDLNRNRSAVGCITPRLQLSLDF